MKLCSRISSVVSGVVLGVFLTTNFAIAGQLDYPRIDPKRRELTNVIPYFGDYGRARLTLSILPTPQGVLARERAVIHSLDGLKPDRVIIMDFLSIDMEKGLVRMMLRINGRSNKIVFDTAKGRFVQWAGPDAYLSRRFEGQPLWPMSGTTDEQTLRMCGTTDEQAFHAKGISLCEFAAIYNCTSQAALWGFVNPLAGLIAGAACSALWAASDACE